MMDLATADNTASAVHQEIAMLKKKIAKIELLIHKSSVKEEKKKYQSKRKKYIAQLGEATYRASSSNNKNDDDDYDYVDNQDLTHTTAEMMEDSFASLPSNILTSPSPMTPSKSPLLAFGFASGVDESGNRLLKLNEWNGSPTNSAPLTPNKEEEEVPTNNNDEDSEKEWEARKITPANSVDQEDSQPLAPVPKCSGKTTKDEEEEEEPPFSPKRRNQEEPSETGQEQQEPFSPLRAYNRPSGSGDSARRSWRVKAVDPDGALASELHGQQQQQDGELNDASAVSKDPPLYPDERVARRGWKPKSIIDVVEPADLDDDEEDGPNHEAEQPATELENDKTEAVASSGEDISPPTDEDLSYPEERVARRGWKVKSVIDVEEPTAAAPTEKEAQPVETKKEAHPAGDADCSNQANEATDATSYPDERVVRRSWKAKAVIDVVEPAERPDESKDDDEEETEKETDDIANTLDASSYPDERTVRRSWKVKAVIDEPASLAENEEESSAQKDDDVGETEKETAIADTADETPSYPEEGTVRRSWKAKAVIDTVPPPADDEQGGSETGEEVQAGEDDAQSVEETANETEEQGSPFSPLRAYNRPGEEGGSRRSWKPKGTSTSITDAVAPAKLSTEGGDRTVVALVSMHPDSLYEQMTKQKRAVNILKGLQIEPEFVDGSDREQRQKRNELFALSGKYAVYPQFFVKMPNGEIKYFCDFDSLELMNDEGDLVQRIQAL